MNATAVSRPLVPFIHTNVKQMKNRLFAAAGVAAVLCADLQSSFAAEAASSSIPVDVTASAEKPEGWNWSPGEGVTYGERPVVSAEASLALDSKFLSYGLVDNDEPILTPGASVTILDWISFGVEALFDVTKYGRRRDADGERLYANRAGRYQELDPSVELAHAFGPDDAAWLPTTVAFALGYAYEYHPRSYATGHDDTQFATFEVGLPDLWVEPNFSYERDLVRDNGTYLALELGHAFELCEGLSLRPSAAQGFGNARRVKGYLSRADGEPLDHAGLMDTLLKLELSYELAAGVTLAGYVGYSDFLFDRTIREGARRYEASGRWDESWNFIGGLSLTLAF